MDYSAPYAQHILFKLQVINNALVGGWISVKLNAENDNQFINIGHIHTPVSEYLHKFHSDFLPYSMN